MSSIKLASHVLAALAAALPLGLAVGVAACGFQVAPSVYDLTADNFIAVGGSLCGTLKDAGDLLNVAQSVDGSSTTSATVTRVDRSGAVAFFALSNAPGDSPVYLASIPVAFLAAPAVDAKQVWFGEAFRFGGVAFLRVFVPPAT